MTPEEAAHAEGFHLDKRIPVATLVMLALQSVAVIWSISGLYSTVDRHTIDIAKLENVGSGPTRERILMLEAQVGTIRDQQAEFKLLLSDIHADLKHLSEKLDQKPRN